MSSKHLENTSRVSRPAADRLLMLLKTRGPQTAAELGAAVGITGEAARQQLVRLAADGLILATSEPRGVGRPVQIWDLTAAGNARFPDGHAELTAHLIQSIRAELGEEVLNRLIQMKTAESKAAYAAALQDAASLQEKVKRLAEARTREGYMAESWKEGDGYLLVENHCPICVAAATCQGFCQAELDTFREVLGPGAAVERDEHIVAGDRRCAYRVTPEAGKRRSRARRD